MRPKDNSKYIATPAKIITTILILLIAVAIPQGIIIQTAMVLTVRKYEPPVQPEAEPSEAEKQLQRIRSSSKNFLPDGTIHLVHTLELTPGRWDQPEKEQIYDANDNLLWEGVAKDRPYEYLSWTKTPQSYREGFNEAQMKQMQMITPDLSRTLEIPVRSREKTEEVWRYEPGREVFVGYRLDGSKIGYIGSTGFTDSKSQAKPFGRFKLFTAWCPEDSFSPMLLWQTKTRVYEIDFEKQQVQLIFKSFESNIKRIRLHKWRPIRPETPRDSKIPYRSLIQCLTEDNKHHLVMKNPDQKVTVTVDDDWWSEVLVFTATTQDILLLRRETERRIPAAYSKSPKLTKEWLRRFEGKPHKEWVELYRVDNEGKLDLLNRFEWTVPARPGPIVKTTYPWEKVKRYVRNFSTPLYDLAWYLLSRGFLIERYRGNDLIYGLAEFTEEFRPGNSVVNWLLSVVMMGFAFLHGWPRRTARGKLILWLVFTGVFNLAGLLTYLALNHTAVIKCPACGRRRGLARVDCVRCGTTLPAPERGKLDLIFNT